MHTATFTVHPEQNATILSFWINLEYYINLKNSLKGHGFKGRQGRWKADKQRLPIKEPGGKAKNGEF